MHVRPAEPADFDAAFTLLDRRNRRLHGVSEVATDQLRRRWELPGLRAWVTGDGEVTGYASLDAAHELEHVAADPAAADALLDAALAEAASRGAATVSLTTDPQDEETRALLRRRGFELDRTILRMWRELDGDLPEPAWPAGVTLRTYDHADGATVNALLDRAYAGWDRGYVARTHHEWLAFMTDHDEFDPALWFLVERDGRLVACALHWREHQGRGWVKDIVVEEGERGRGLGRALLRHAFRAYAARGTKRVGLKVDASNPTGARQLYERAGFVVDRCYELWQRTP